MIWLLREVNMNTHHTKSLWRWRTGRDYMHITVSMREAKIPFSWSHNDLSVVDFLISFCLQTLPGSGIFIFHNMVIPASKRWESLWDHCSTSIGRFSVWVWICELYCMASSSIWDEKGKYTIIKTSQKECVFCEHCDYPLPLDAAQFSHFSLQRMMRDSSYPWQTSEQCMM